MKEETKTLQQLKCHHCGDSCPDESIHIEEKHFCCEGCKTVFQILEENELCTYYDIEKHPGTRLNKGQSKERFAYLDYPEIIAQLTDFKNDEFSTVTFFLPQIHCSSCIWLLEKLYLLRPEIQKSRVNFMRKTVHLNYDHHAISLREIVELLSSIAYEPHISLDQRNKKNQSHVDRPFYLRLGVAGFCFGNIMLFSFPEYLGISQLFEGQFIQFFGWLNWILSLPVLLYSAQLFFKPAWEGLKQRVLNIDIPVSLGILAIFARSTFEIFSHSGAGYLDSLAGLVFFLLIGKWFQRKTYDTLSFDKDYTAYFPLSTTKIVNGQAESVPVTRVVPQDLLLIRNQELIPADSILLSDSARIDYSFVTGESLPVPKKKGDLIYAGGRQVGTTIKLQVVKEMSHSYLTQLWNQDTDEGNSPDGLQNLADKLSKNFTLFILATALVGSIFWGIFGSISQAVQVFTAVLIVACPCGLALTSPIILGNTMRLFGKRGFYLKQSAVLEKLAEIEHVVFDKTGTLTQKHQEGGIHFQGEMDEGESMMVASLTQHSQHPLSRMIFNSLGQEEDSLWEVDNFEELAGKGIKGNINGKHIILGSSFFLEEQTGEKPAVKKGTWFSIDGQLKGYFLHQINFRDSVDTLLTSISKDYEMSLLSGDGDKDAPFLAPYFDSENALRFQQSPMDKQAYIKELQHGGKRVMMVGDGLNDAGALKAANIGIAVSESAETFSPACDGIMEGSRVAYLSKYMEWARSNVRLIQIGFVLSLIYNCLGLGIALMGWLTPLVAAILMPLSSISVVIYGMVATWVLGEKMGIPPVTKVS
ncbi:MAG: heavy metal translocating P-type ATPase metal-binding domain-containing protein [Bacteroidia bacterium]|nr:heavy metal translocating P-type ATPase metal-binding domain-containing protein [Bacteroidia bacterium]